MTTPTKAIAIIPAKGTSIRIPHKNIRSFCGRPMLWYSLRALQLANEDDVGGEPVIDKVVVASDDDEIGMYASRNGAVYYRRAHADCTDDQPMIDVILEVLYHEDEEYDYVCMVYPCAPFIQLGSVGILAGYKQLLATGADVAFPVYKAPDAVERSLLMVDGRVKSRYPEYDNTNSQAFQPTYHSAGQWYWGRTRSLMTQKTWMCDSIAGVEIDPRYAIDIDTMDDWEEAEMRYMMLSRGEYVRWAVDHIGIVGKHLEMERGGLHGSVCARYQDGKWQTVDSSVTKRTVLT